MTTPPKNRPCPPAALERRRLYCVLLWCGALATALLLTVMNWSCGALNQDEGWYLYAARLVSEGRLPYRDFASTQGPVMPFAYALAKPLTVGLGVAGGRAFTALLGWLAALGAAALAGRMADPARRRTAAFLAFTLCAVNVYQSYFTTVVKTYALTSCLLVLGFTALSWWRSRKGVTAAFAAGICLALAAGTRISAGAILPAVGLVFLWEIVRKRRTRPTATLWSMPETRALLGLVAGSVLTLLLIFWPFALLAPRALWFALVEYHAGRQTAGWLQALAYRIGFFSRIAQAYFVLFCLALAAGFAATLRLRAAAAPRACHDAPATDPLLRSVLLGGIAVTLLHLAAAFPYDDYQTILTPLFAAAVALALTRIRLPSPAIAAPSANGAGPTHGADAQVPLRLLVLTLCAVAAFSSPINFEWALAPRDRIWWPLRDETPLFRLRRVGRMLREIGNADPDAYLLTQDPYLAVESGYRLPPGMELGPFSYFPDWPREKAAALRVMNRAMLLETIAAAPAPLAAFSGYSLAIRAPQIIPLTDAEQQELQNAVAQRYRLIATVETFGQADTTLRILARKDPSPASPRIADGNRDIKEYFLAPGYSARRQNADQVGTTIR